MGVIDQVAKSLLKQAVVTGVFQIAAHTYHLKIAGDSLRNQPFVPGNTLKVFIALNADGLVIQRERKYSIWNYDAANGIVDLAVCTFSNGAAAHWIVNRKKGDAIYFIGPSGSYTIDYDAQHYFFAGDITTLSHFYQLNRSLKNKMVLSLIQATDKRDGFADVDGTSPLHIQVSDESISSAVIRKIETTGFHHHNNDGIFYRAGSPDFCKELNTLFRRKYNWPVSRVRTKAFWK